ncbi:MAG: nicotinate-nucleotide--dimethylbenzimidazole phosphoribosyltransferase [Firmicutes bacterium]|nr:nicotinate-nucleotide--dimethylbenzimidazole phosphoribosyltransferase [Bacillota bacterium]
MDGTNSAMQVVNDAAERIMRPCEKSRAQAAARLDQLTKPKGSLGELEAALVAAAGMQRLAIPRFDMAHVVIMAGDHGVTAQGISAYPSEVTAQMVQNFLQGGAAVSALCRQVGATVHVVDIGVKTALSHPLLLARNVRRGTRDFAREEALTTAEVWQALAVGVQLGESLGAGGGRVLALGEMGIGNTTSSAALLAAMTGEPVAALTGYGTGVDEAQRLHKVAVIESALRLHRPDPRNPLDLLRKIGGLEIAGLAGLAIGGAAQHCVILADGLISTVAILIAELLEPRVKQYVIAGHQSAEPGHPISLARLGVRPLLGLGLRLGEASGAVLALSVLQGAQRALREMATFAQADVAQALREDGRDQSTESLGSAELPAPDEPEVTSIQPQDLATPERILADAEPGMRYSAEHLEFTADERDAVYKAIYLRRDIRSFKSDPLPEDAIRRILQAGHHGPSVGFMQPWNFILIRDDARKLALRAVVERERQAAAIHFEDERQSRYLALKVEGLREAPITICVTSDPTRGGKHVLGRNSIPETDLFSVSCAIENMWLAARAENIALGWVSIYKKGDIRALLSIPHHVEPVGLLSLGYTEQWPQRPLLQTAGWRDRLPFTEVLYYEDWGVTSDHVSG